MVKGGLGKGLGALLSDFDQPAENGWMELDIYKLDPNPMQPRKSFDEDRLNELADSIRLHGIVQPILVRPNNDRFMIVAGERRWRAAQIAGLSIVPAIVRTLDDQQLLEVSLIENIQRNDLNPLEEAAAIKFLMDQHDLTQEEVSERLSKSRPAIANMLRLLNLPDVIKDVLINGRLTAGHARALLALSNPTRMVELADKVLDQGLSVRATEALVRKEVSPQPKAQPNHSKIAPELTDVEESLREALGTRVKIMGAPDKGKVVIDYYSVDQLERLCELLKNEA